MNTHLSLTIELVATQPVAGSISSGDSRPTAFEGWLELHAALETLCEAARGDAPASETP